LRSMRNMPISTPEPTIKQYRMIRRMILPVAMLLFAGCGPETTSSGEKASYEYPWYNPEITFKERLSMLMDQMTTEEKISQLVYDAPAIERLGIPEYNWWNEALHGVARDGRATVFPQTIGLAATFDKDLIYRIFSAISDEARAKFRIAVDMGNRGRYAGLTFWTPNINIFRDPRWGRGMETYGEDPYLTSQLGMACVKGLQGDDPHYLKTAACAKHFAVHSGPEALRHEFNAVVNMKDLHETYLPAFKALVTEANVEAVMGAYNRVNGEPACASRLLLRDILTDSWDFQGHIVSDCWALQDIHRDHKVTASPVESAALALNMGVNLNCGDTYPYLGEALEQGLITEATIDERLARLFITRFKLGLFDPSETNPYNNVDESVINSEGHLDLAYEAAVKSLVLLKNSDHALPLDPEIKSLFVTGPQANNSEVLIGNYYGMSGSLVNILEGITSRVSAGTTILYKQGVLDYMENINPIDWTTGDAQQADAIVAVMGISGLLEGEEGAAIASPTKGDRLDLNLPANQIGFLKKLRAGYEHPLIVVMTGGSPMTMPEVEELADAILWVWYPGQEGGNAVADVLFGKKVPSGKLPVTFPVSVDQLPDYEDYSMAGRTYRYMPSKPLYPFGYGLSYADFGIDELTLSANEVSPGEKLKVSVLVENRGDMEADETVQLYITCPEGQADQPLWSLREFKRISLNEGETTQVTFELDREDLVQYDAEGNTVLTPGTYRVHVGNGSPGERSRELGVEMVSGTFRVVE
jgi:beta-glucosidase